VEFEITFFVAELGAAGAVQSELFDHVFRHLAASGIALAAPPDLRFRPRSDGMGPKPTTLVEGLLELVVIFATLTREERSTAAAKLKRASHDQGDVLLEPGTVLQSLFIIGCGVVAVTARDEDGSELERRLGPGDHFGEVGLLTGAASRA